MPGRVVLVHDESEFVDRAAAALRLAGYDVTGFTDPMVALDALGAADPVDLVITRVRFAPGKPHGISLVLTARTRHPRMRVLFTALPEYAALAAGIGEFMPLPIELPELVERVDRLLKSGARNSN